MSDIAEWCGQEIAKRSAALDAIASEFGGVASRKVAAEMEAAMQGANGLYRHGYERRFVETALARLRASA